MERQRGQSGSDWDDITIREWVEGSLTGRVEGEFSEE